MNLSEIYKNQNVTFYLFNNASFLSSAHNGKMLELSGYPIAFYRLNQ